MYLASLGLEDGLYWVLTLHLDSSDVETGFAFRL